MDIIRTRHQEQNDGKNVMPTMQKVFLVTDEDKNMQQVQRRIREKKPDKNKE